jgi:hypothetical protein
MSTILLIMLPKVLAFYGIYGGNSATRRGTSRGVTFVSGIEAPAAAASLSGSLTASNRPPTMISGSSCATARQEKTNIQ